MRNFRVILFLFLIENFIVEAFTNNLLYKEFYEVSKDSIIISSETENIYILAYEYISTDLKEKEISISNKLIGTLYSFFANELNFEKEEIPILLDMEYEEDCTFLFLNEMYNKEDCKYIISFSRLINSVDLFCIVQEKRNYISSLGSSICYYFRFNKKGCIDTVYKNEYNGL